jgi:hypothetical protein
VDEAWQQSCPWKTLGQNLLWQKSVKASFFDKIRLERSNYTVITILLLGQFKQPARKT